MPTSLRSIDSSTNIGDVITTTRTLDSTFLPTNGGVYNQADYPLLYSAVGLIGKPAGYVWSLVASSTISAGQMATDGKGVWIRGGQRSLDNGVTWTAITVALETIATDSKGTWVGGSGGQTYRSIDNGATWAQVQSSGTVGTGYPSRCVATDGNGNWVSTKYGDPYLVISKDNGVTWTIPTTNPGQGGSIAVVAIGNNTWIAANGFRSLDNGTSWAQYGTAQSTFSTDRGHMCIDNIGRIVFTGTNGMRRSSNNGLTWTSVTTVASTNSSGGGTIVDAAGNIFNCNSTSSLNVSSDDGVTWQAVNAGVGNIYSIVYSQGRMAINTAQGFAISDESFSYNKATQFAAPTIQPVPGLKSYIKAKF